VRWQITPSKDRKDEDEDEDENEDDRVDIPFNFFNNFDSQFFDSKQFKQIFKEIYKKISEFLPPQFRNLSPEDVQKMFMENKSKFGFPGGPFVTGFNISIKPDGTPVVDSFGNIKTKPGDPGEPKEYGIRKPLVEINEEPTQIIVVAEMPGVTKEEIELKATSHSLTISTKASDSDRNYYKEVELPTAINSDYAKARYQNGILEVKLKKIDEKHTNIKVD